MDLKKRGLVFTEMARHRRVSQCLGSMLGKEILPTVPDRNSIGLRRFEFRAIA